MHGQQNIKKKNNEV